MSPDLINGCFELVGSAMLWRNVWQLHKDKMVQGVHWNATAFFTSWGLFNLWFYPAYDLYWSFLGGVSLVIANTVWLGQLIYYARKDARSNKA